MRVLVVEDDGELAEAIAAGLRLEGMAVDTALDGDAALDRALVNDYDVIVLDRDLPGVHGDEVCARLVDGGGRSRVLMLTAAATSGDVVDGLALGADDYLPKPFDFPVLVARIGALARRTQPSIPPVLASGDVVLDTARRSVRRAGQHQQPAAAVSVDQAGAHLIAVKPGEVAVEHDHVVVVDQRADEAGLAIKRNVDGHARVP